MKFKFSLKDRVQITVSGEIGKIIARAQYVASESTYLLVYCGADGRAVEKWWVQSHLSEIADDRPAAEGGEA